MFHRWFVLALVLPLGVGSLADAATIVWVSDNKAPANGVPADQGWIDVLMAEGYTVNLSFRNQGARTLDAAEIAALNAADLIIIGRDTDSASYASDAAEIATWHALTTPILMQVPQIAQNNRQKWGNAGGVSNSMPAMLAVVPTHPVFEGVTLAANNQVDLLTANSDFLSTAEPGNGILIGKRADNSQIWIVEWSPGVEYYAGSGTTAGGRRMLFVGGAKAGVPDGTYNYNDTGKKMFLNAVRYMIGTRPVASKPVPEDGAVDVPSDAALSWKTTLASRESDVYLGTAIEDVNTATTAKPLGELAGAGVSANTFQPAALLEYGQTYYWRIDEVNTTADATVFKGDIWSFTVEPFAYPIANVTATASGSQPDMGPENTINGIGLNAKDQHSTDGKQMWLSAGELPNWIQYEFDKVYKLDEIWVWNSNQQVEGIIGFGAKDVAVEYSVDGSTWTPLAGVPVFTRAPGSVSYAHDIVVDFGGVQAKYVKLTINSTWGGSPRAGLAEVRFLYVPLQAREPRPSAPPATAGNCT